ncbi:thymidine kinase [Maribrevibacterium harenarium]|uniref:Thymidine kinase n=1 Tax=Maribrevibacterium harenarium TaxID=2589817 RepID=A0A501WGI5_9GAMM|nr:thymidine kinase [Maribrevibacterium harenarium]TPE47595.1 thymidine kinase [Maribrevibacterium harenarium]
MAKLYFYYSAMNAGKSTILLQSAHNYRERGMQVILYTAAIDDRFEQGKIASRIGIAAEANLFQPDTNLFAAIAAVTSEQNTSCVLIDEAQFLTTQQVQQLTDVVDELGIPVLAFGIRTDFRGELFAGSQALLAWSDKLIELKTVCHCGSKATMVLRLDERGNVVKDGEQVEIGGNDRYVSVCRQHFKAGISGSPNHVV